MLGATDYPGIAAVVAAVFAGLASLIGAFNARTVRNVRDQVSTNGDPRTLGEMVQQSAPPAPPESDKPPA